MDEDLDVDPRHGGAVAHFAEREFAREDDAGETHPRRGLNARATVHRHLRARVESE